MSNIQQENKLTFILQHPISYFYKNGQDMPDDDREYIQQMIIKGENQGKLNAEYENTGEWWIKGYY